MLGLVDYIVFGVSLTAFVVIGVFRAVITKCWKTSEQTISEDIQEEHAILRSNGKQSLPSPTDTLTVRSKVKKEKKSARDFLLGISHHEIITATLSLFASFVSATTLIGLPAAVYRSGIHYFVIAFTFGLSVTFANLIVIPVFVQHEFKTTFEYLEKRFDRRVFLISVILYIINSFFASGLWLGVPARVLSQLSGLSIEWTILFTEVVVIFYAFFGGMKVIVNAHVIQTVIVLFSSLAVVVKGIVVVGGVGSVIEGNTVVRERNKYFDFDVNPFTEKSTTVSLFLGYFVYWAMTYSTNQSVLSRLQPASDLTKARRILWFQIPLMMIMYFLVFFLGLVMYAFYRSCDPFLTKRVETAEQILPLFVDDIGSHVPGVLGVWLTGIFSASLSTIASNLNAVSTVANEHFIQPYFALTPKVTNSKGNSSKGKSTTDQLNSRSNHLLWKYFGDRPLLLIRVLAVSLSIFMLCFTWIGVFLKDSLKARIVFANAFSCPSFGVFLLGLLNPKCTSRGAFIGCLSGVTTGITLLITHYVFKKSTSVAGINVDDCPQVFCYQVGLQRNQTEACLNNAYKRIQMMHPFLISASLTEFDWKSTLNISPQWGGVFSVLITIITGSIISLMDSQEQEGRVRQLVATFLQKDIKVSDKEQEKDL